MRSPIVNNPLSAVSTGTSSPGPRGFTSSGIPLTQQADVEQVLGLTATSDIDITGRVGDIASLNASNTLGLSVDTDKLHVLNHSANSPITITDLVCVAGGRASVKQSNPDEFVYIKGCEFTDGSLRLLPDITSKKIEFQLRTNGVWNETGIQAVQDIFLIANDAGLIVTNDACFPVGNPI